MAPRKKKDPIEGAEIVPVPPKNLVLEGDPETQLAFAKKAADALMNVVTPRKIGDKDYLEFGAWQILGRFFGATVGVEWTKPVFNQKNEIVGYEARSMVLQHGTPISYAEASCLRSERNWRGREEFAVKSMAQTRASAKALRNAFGWVAELAGFQSTPAEEMDFDQSKVADTAPVIMVGTDTDGVELEPTVDELRIELAKILRSRGVDVKDKKACEEFVADATQLALTPENLTSIIKKLKELE